MNWQPIAGAPMDGSAVIVLTEHREVKGGYWDDGLDAEGEPYEEPSWYWFDQHETGPCEPTHFMPFPAPLE